MFKVPVKKLGQVDANDIDKVREYITLIPRTLMAAGWAATGLTE